MAGVEYRAGTQATAPVANTTAGKWTFTPGASHLLLSNLSGKTTYIRFNSASAAAVATHDYVLVDGATVNLSAADLGVVTFDTVSVWFPADATVVNWSIRGI